MVIYHIISCVSLAYVVVGFIVSCRICHGMSKVRHRRIRLSSLFRLTIIVSWPLALSLLGAEGVNIWD